MLIASAIFVYFVLSSVSTISYIALCGLNLSLLRRPSKMRICSAYYASLRNGPCGRFQLLVQFVMFIVFRLPLQLREASSPDLGTRDVPTKNSSAAAAHRWMGSWCWRRCVLRYLSTLNRV